VGRLVGAHSADLLSPKANPWEKAKAKVWTLLEKEKALALVKDSDQSGTQEMLGTWTWRLSELARALAALGTVTMMIDVNLHLGHHRGPHHQLVGDMIYLRV